MPEIASPIKLALKAEQLYPVTTETLQVNHAEQYAPANTIRQSEVIDGTAATHFANPETVEPYAVQDDAEPSFPKSACKSEKDVCISQESAEKHKEDAMSFGK